MRLNALVFIPTRFHLISVLTLGLTACASEEYKAVDDVSGLSSNEGQLICADYGPQTPRDIDSRVGLNAVEFPVAPAYDELNLCNIHFHKNAEHKAAAFSILGGTGDERGYQCQISTQLTAAELTPATSVCNGLQPGDTIEVHWVHSSCDIQPGEGLGSCLSEECTDPALRVETQVFTLVNDSSALNFNDYDYTGQATQGLHQARAIPTGTGTPVQFLGSTTGPSYNDQVCSPVKVSWSVRPQCAKLDINSLATWCEDNTFAESKAHGVRKLVTNPQLLSEIE